MRRPKGGYFVFSWIRPAWPDEARLIAQQPTIARLGRIYPLSGRCLNAGCGEGLYCRFLEGFQDITEIVNVDLAGTPQRLRRLMDTRHRSLDASLTALPFPDGLFDSCLCTEVLEHIPDDNRAVAELARCLRPGGRLLLSVPHPPAPFDPNHVREGYTLADLVDLLGRHGIQVAASERCFGKAMATLLSVWRWQHGVLGRGRRNFMPRAVVCLAGYADRVLPLGHRWDVAVVGVKT
jgi:SAM-dependent methyltransferase